MAYSIEVNGQKRTVDVDGDTPLLWVLRDELDLKGTKFGCGVGLCGACTVHLDGKAGARLHHAGLRRRPRRSHHHRGHAAHPRREAGAGGLDGARRAPVRLLPGRPDHVRDGLLTTTPQPTDADIDAAMSGNICRCATYTRIRAAIKQAADRPADTASDARTK